MVNKSVGTANKLSQLYFRYELRIEHYYYSARHKAEMRGSR